MVALIDTNVILDYLSRRSGFFESARKQIEGYVAFHSLPNIWYITRKKPEELRRAYLERICRILRVAGAGHDAVLEAIRDGDFADFEDCLQDKCAWAVHADYIVTRNVRDFLCAGTVAVTPEELLRKLGGGEPEGRIPGGG